MKVFISWSGALSQAVAGVLRQHLSSMIQQLDVFMSKHDIESGSRWGAEIADELDKSSFGIICLTPDNQSAPWILFEAGALAKHINGRVCCLLFNGLKPTDMTGPLTQFQNRPFSKEEFKNLVHDINAKLPQPLREEQLNRIFEKWWDDIEKECRAVMHDYGNHASIPPIRNSSDLLDEILLRMRAVEKTVSTVADVIRVRRPGDGFGIGDLAISGRVLDNLREDGIYEIEQLLALSETELRRVPGIADRSIKEIRTALENKGLTMKE